MTSLDDLDPARFSAHHHARADNDNFGTVACWRWLREGLASGMSRDQAEHRAASAAAILSSPQAQARNREFEAKLARYQRFEARTHTDSRPEAVADFDGAA